LQNTRKERRERGGKRRKKERRGGGGSNFAVSAPDGKPASNPAEVARIAVGEKKEKRGGKKKRGGEKKGKGSLRRRVVREPPTARSRS